MHISIDCLGNSGVNIGNNMGNFFGGTEYGTLFWKHKYLIFFKFLWVMCGFNRNVFEKWHLKFEKCSFCWKWHILIKNSTPWRLAQSESDAFTRASGLNHIYRTLHNSPLEGDRSEGYNNNVRHVFVRMGIFWFIWMGILGLIWEMYGLCGLSWEPPRNFYGNSIGDLLCYACFCRFWFFCSTLFWCLNFSYDNFS